VYKLILLKKHKKTTIKSLTALFLIIVLFLGIGPASAAQLDVGPTGYTYNTIQAGVNAGSDGDVVNVHSATYAEDVVVNKKLTIKANIGDIVELTPTNTGFTVVNNSTGDGSGSTIDGFKITNSPGGTGVNISAANCTVKNNQITGGTIGILALTDNTLVSNNVISNVLNNSIQVGSIQIINDSGTPKNIGANPNNCKVENNQITGGLTGIAFLGDNAQITGNEISQAQERGIYLFGCNPTISGNTIKDMVGGGSKGGIQLATINFTGTTGLKITGNTLINIISTNDTVLGIDAFAMTMNYTLDSILIMGNTISNLYGISKATALSIVALALNGPLSTVEIVENTINNVTSQGVNGTSSAISLVAMGFKNDSKTYNNTTSSDSLIISKNKITGINSEDENGTSKGISFVQLCSGNTSISENNLSGFNADLMAVGITSAGVDYTTFQSNVTIANNIITDFTSNNITSGIQSMNLGNSNIIHNNIFQLNSARTKYMVVQSILQGNTIIMGNNLEGTGIGEGIAVNGNHTTISYNRIVNFQHNIQNINGTEASSFSHGQTFYTDQEIRDYLLSKNGTYVNGTFINLTEDNITTIIDLYHQFMNSMDNVTCNTNSPYNWYGTNSDPGNDKFLIGNGTLNYTPWLVMSIHANPSTIYPGQNSAITADVYQDSSGEDHSKDAAMYFNGPQVTFTTDLGNVGSKSVMAQWANGFATAILRADEGSGVATVTATDYQTVRTFVTILGAVETSTVVNSANNTIGMQKTGTPLNYLILAMLMMISGLISTRRR
jgi:parallel beta-helix repeat protein